MAGAMSCRKAMDLFIASTPMDAQNEIEPSGVHRGESEMTESTVISL